MRRPASSRAKPLPTSFRPEIAEGLIRYFSHHLALAKKAKSSGLSSAIWPTVRGFCLARGINVHTLRSWAKNKPEMRQALTVCAQIRVEFSKLEMNFLTFDTELDAAT